MSDGILFLMSLLDCGVLLGLNVWFLILLSDLECDYINASTACRKLNKFVMVRFSFISKKQLNVRRWYLSWIFFVTLKYILSNKFCKKILRRIQVVARQKAIRCTKSDLAAFRGILG
jgi:hypothetical protein